jgi:glycosyltransferase involved in cell wall biosynthesis
VRILITNNTLDQRAGTEVYVRDLATALIRRGHHPVAYSQALGEVAEELRGAGVPVVDDLARMAEPPDVIHGHHHLETMTALNWFAGVPAIFVCHGWLPWQEAPPAHPRILRYVAVDELCRQRIVDEGGIDPDTVEVILNFVDLDRFRPRQPLPGVPGRALLFSNQVSSGKIADEIARACSERGIALDVVGLASGNPTAHPEDLLPQYDLVFAKARAALEAMAVGCAVILCDTPGLGPLVDPGNFDDLRPLNFGFGALSSPVSAEAVSARLARYHRDDATAVRDRVRGEANLSKAVGRFLMLYREVAVGRAALPEDEGRANAAYLRVVAPRIKENDRFHLRVADAVAQTDAWRRRAEKAEADLAQLEAEHEETRAATGVRIGELEARNLGLGRARDRLEAEMSALQTEVSNLRDLLDRAFTTVTWRMRERVLGWRLGRFAHRLLRRR